MSLWWKQVDHPDFSPGTLDQQWDLVIVGGGFSGLWSAYHALAIDPSLKIAVLEQSRIGTGASGRNGGWASALYPLANEKLARHSSQESIDQLHKQLQGSIDEIGNFAKEHDIECGFHKGGRLSFARNGGQLKRLADERESDETFLSTHDSDARIHMSKNLGANYSPHCAALNPAALIVGLAQHLETRGVSLFENTLAQFDAKNNVSVNGRAIKTSAVVRATEAYQEGTRKQIPVYSLMIATDPLPDKVLKLIGGENRETFADGSHVVNYAQRTSDGRLALGGRGAPYTWGSQRNDKAEVNKRIHAHLRTMAREWFPVLHDYDFPHSWGGAVAITRDWSPYVRWDGKYGELGGYVGDGVTLSYLAAAAMADLLTHTQSVRTSLPFVQRSNPKWEPEPLRWLAINSAIALSSVSDHEENLTQRPSLLMKALAPIIGK